MTGHRVGITTANKPDAALEREAQRLAQEMTLEFIPRRTETLDVLAREGHISRFLIVERNRLRLFDPATTESYAYHPNLLPVRLATIARGGQDLFLHALDLTEGESVLDCTLGFGTEATLAAMYVGRNGIVVGLESVPELAAVTRAGMQSASFPAETQVVDAMRHVRVVTADYRPFLSACETRAYDVVYFDPFFAERLPGSENSVGPLAQFGNRDMLTVEALREARRVARRRVVVKTPKHRVLSAEIAQDASTIVMTRKSRVAYCIFAPSVRVS